MTSAFRSILCAVILSTCCVGSGAWSEESISSHRPEIYFYGPPAVLKDGSVVASPLSVDINQMTTLFPEVSDMDGVVLVLTWSELEPAEGKYSFELLDKTIAFWKERKKKVVFGISVAGPMVRSVSDAGPILTNQAPPWLMSKIQTYSAPATTIGVVGRPGPVETAFPSYWDPLFVNYFKKLIVAIGSHLKGETAISHVRISTGLIGEDAPTPFGVNAAKMPGFTCEKWVDYSYQVTNAFIAQFRDFALEYDLSYLPWCYAGHSADDKAKVDEFINYLIEKRIFIAFNGLQAQLPVWIGNREKGSFALDRLAHYLFLAKSHGLDVGLEAIGPMFVPKMQDIGSLASAIRAVRPRRLVFFGVDVAGLKFLREGRSGGIEATLKWANGDEERLRRFGLDLSSLLKQSTD